MADSRVECPNCGYENRRRAIKCNLCNEIMPTALAAIENAPPLPTTNAVEPKSPKLPEARTSFYQEMEQNKSKSITLIMAMLLLMATLGAAVGAVYGDPIIGTIVMTIIAWMMGLISWRSGASMILAMSGARRITNDDFPQLFNVVEEMKIASGLPMPAVCLINSSAANAFATGRDQDNSAIAVTTGLVEKLSRDELQTVVGHEMGHIRNLDIRVMQCSPQ